MYFYCAHYVNICLTSHNYKQSQSHSDQLKPVNPGKRNHSVCDPQCDSVTRSARI